MAEAQLVSETLCHFYHINNTQSSQSFRIHSSGVYSFSLETIIQEKARPIFFHFLIPKTYPSPFEVFESTESWDRYRGNVCVATIGTAVTYGWQNLRQSQI